MANHVSALKRARQSEARRIRNKAYRTQVRNAIKQVRTAIEEKDLSAAQAAMTKAESVLDRAAGKGVYHPRNAARRVSRLASQVNALQS